MASRASSYAPCIPAQPSRRRPPSRRISAIGALAALTITLAGCGAAGGDTPTGPAGADTTPVSATTSEATISLSVALQSPHLSEAVRLRVGGADVATWTSDSKKPSGVLTLNGILEGDHPYEFQGTYTFYNSNGILQQQRVQGSGTFTVANNGYYTVIYDPTGDTYTIQRLR